MKVSICPLTLVGHLTGEASSNKWDSTRLQRPLTSPPSRKRQRAIVG